MTNKKQCRYCGIEKSIDDFCKTSVSKSYPDGRLSKCNECRKMHLGRDNVRPPTIKKFSPFYFESGVKRNYKVSTDRANEYNAMPKWLDEMQKMQIQWFYAAARMMTETTGIQHHVDHIEPLRGWKSCGLHVPWNLQCIPAAQNVKKNIKFPY